jgi:hypothetical protein
LTRSIEASSLDSQKASRRTNTGTPLMRHYFEHYYDLYWDLHVGVTGTPFPTRSDGSAGFFNAVLGFWFPKSEAVRKAYAERARRARR